MGFRPIRVVTGPTGTWEIYVSKTATPGWKPGDYDVDLGRGSEPAEEIVGGVMSFIWWDILYPLGRFVFLLPFAYLKGRRSHAIRIEALNPFPVRQMLLWTTIDAQLEAVLDEIAAGLAEGRIVQPIGAVYSGEETG